MGFAFLFTFWCYRCQWYYVSSRRPIWHRLFSIIWGFTLNKPEVICSYEPKAIICLWLLVLRSVMSITDTMFLGAYARFVFCAWKRMKCNSHFVRLRTLPRSDDWDMVPSSIRLPAFYPTFVKLHCLLPFLKQVKLGWQALSLRIWDCSIEWGSSQSIQNSSTWEVSLSSFLLLPLSLSLLGSGLSYRGLALSVSFKRNLERTYHEWLSASSFCRKE